MTAERRTRAAALALAALAGAATATCRDATGPYFTVAVVATLAQAPITSTDAGGLPLITCDVQLEAGAAGAGSAAWMDATLYFFVANDRRTPFDSAVVPAATIASSRGEEVIDAGATQRSGWSLSASVPFAVTFAYRYQVVGGALRSTSASASCVPAVPSGPPPQTATLASDPSSLFEPGKTLVLHETATSAVGLWASAVHLAGPCDTTFVYADSLLHTVTRTVRILLPAACNLGVPLVATLEALDASLQTTERSLTLPALVDTTPPAIEINGYAGLPAHDFFAGDSIGFFFGATDNHALRSLNWEFVPQGDKDSLLVSGTNVDPSVQIPVPVTWSGPTQLSVYARDASGNTSAAVTTAPGAMHVVPSTTPGMVMSTINAGVGNWAWDERRGLLYGTYDFSGLMYSVTRSQGASTELLWLQQATSTVSLTPGGDSLVVLLPTARALAFVDLRSAGHPVGRVVLSGIDSSFGLGMLAVMSNGKILISAQNGTGTGHIYSYDLGTGTLALRQDAGDGGETGAGLLGVSANGAVAVVNGGPGRFQRYDAATDAFGPLATARASGILQVADSGTLVAVGPDLYDGNLQYLRTPEAMGTVPPGQPIALSPDGQVLYLAYGNVGVIRSRVSDGTTIDRLRLPLAVNAALSVSPDGATLLVQEGALSGGLDRIGLVAVPALPAAVPPAPRPAAREPRATVRRRP